MAPTKRGKATKQIALDIKRTIAGLLGSLYTRAEILQVIGEKYGIKDSQCDKYLKEVRSEMREELAGSQDDYRATIVQSLKDLKMLALKRGNLNVALGSINTLIKVFGLDVNKFEVTGAEGQPIKLDHEVKIERSIEHVAEVTRILCECGAVKTGIDSSNQSTDE